MNNSLYSSPMAMEPMFPRSADLEESAIELIRTSAALGSMLHPTTRRTVVEMLRSINSYYSNLIEGHATHPLDIERAMRGDYSEEPAKRVLQLESKAHVDVDKLINDRLRDDETTSVCSTDFLRWIHEEFYSRMPQDYRVVLDPATGDELSVIPGELRTTDVIAGRHIAPTYDSLPRLLDRFKEAYDPRSGMSETRRVLNLAASHHRLLWIHPFLDGNGRVARLFSGAYARSAGIDGHGLWTATRGLARSRKQYMAALATADSERINDYDGRGNLSLEGLNEFCRFFMEICLDQISFMSSALELDDLGSRIRGYVRLRSESMVPRLGELRLEAVHLLIAALHHGQVKRGEAARITGLGARTARSLVSKLREERLLYSETPKGPLRLGLPIHVVNYYFPRLYSEDTTLVAAE